MHSIKSPIMLLSIYPIVLLLACLLPVYNGTTEPDETSQQCYVIYLKELSSVTRSRKLSLYNSGYLTKRLTNFLSMPCVIRTEIISSCFLTT